MPKYDFNKVAKQFSCKFGAYFRTPFLKNTSGWLLLNILELMNFIKEKDPYSKEYITYTNIHTENYNVNKENESFISGLKESYVSYITNNKIIKKH